jgi:hypothetical protein
MRNDSTGFTPFELMYGRQPRLPVDVILSLQSDSEERSYSEYIADLRRKLQSSYELAIQKSDASKESNVEYYRSRGASLKVGDRVLVKRLAFPEGRHKLSDKWEEDVYVVVNHVDPDVPVFDVRRENNPKGGRCKRLHRNHLLPIGSIQDVVDGSGQKEKQEELEKKSENGDESEVESEEDQNDLQLYMSSSEDEEFHVNPTEAAAVDRAAGSEVVPDVGRRVSQREKRQTSRYQSVDFRR